MSARRDTASLACYSLPSLTEVSVLASVHVPALLANPASSALDSHTDSNTDRTETQLACGASYEPTDALPSERMQLYRPVVVLWLTEVRVLASAQLSSCACLLLSDSPPHHDSDILSTITISSTTIVPAAAPAVVAGLAEARRAMKAWWRRHRPAKRQGGVIGGAVAKATASQQ